MSAIVNVVLPIFGLILAGYVCRRSGRLGETASNELSRFVVWLALPALLFNVTATASWEQLWQPGFIASVCVPAVRWCSRRRWRCACASRAGWSTPASMA